MKTEMLLIRFGRVVAAAGLVLLAAVGLSRAEVGASLTWEGNAAKIVGYHMQAIGDDPDPVPPTIWRLYAGGQAGRYALNPGGEANGDGAPSMLSDPSSGLLAAAWARNSASGFDIVTSRFENGAWTAPAVVVDVAANALDPQLVLDASGIVHLLYWVDGPATQVLHVQAFTDFSSWSPPVLVSQPGQTACRPAGTIFQGVLRVAYEVHDFGYGNSPRQVVLARYDAGAFVPEIVAITNNLGDVRPEVHAHAGHLWVDWIDVETAGSGEVAWTRIDGQGHWESLHYEPFANGEQRDYLVRGGVRMKAIR